jgi:hypothetical protein
MLIYLVKRKELEIKKQKINPFDIFLLNLLYNNVVFLNF